MRKLDRARQASSSGAILRLAWHRTISLNPPKNCQAGSTITAPVPPYSASGAEPRQVDLERDGGDEHHAPNEIRGPATSQINTPRRFTTRGRMSGGSDAPALAEPPRKRYF